MQRNLKLGNSIKDCSFVEMNSYANMRTMNTSNSQDSELSSSESKGSDLSRIKNSVQDINSFTSEHVLFSDCILDKNSSREKVKQTKTTETYNRGKMLKISNCLKINWLRKVSNLKSSLLNKLISRLNFQNNGKINQFNLKSLFRKVKGKNTNRKFIFHF